MMTKYQLSIAGMVVVLIGAASAFGVSYWDDANQGSDLSGGKVTLKGIWHIVHRDAVGNILSEQWKPNLIVDNGEDTLQSVFGVGTLVANAVDVICIGLTSTAAGETQTGLLGPFDESTNIDANTNADDGCQADSTPTGADNTAGNDASVTLDATWTGAAIPGTGQVTAGSVIVEAILTRVDNNTADNTGAGDNALTGEVFSRAVFSSVTLNAGDSLQISYSVSITAT